MDDYKVKLEAEKNELEEKLANLRKFLRSDRVYKIDENQKKLLIIQKQLMHDYLKILKERLKLT